MNQFMVYFFEITDLTQLILSIIEQEQVIKDYEEFIDVRLVKD